MRLVNITSAFQIKDDMFKTIIGIVASICFCSGQAIAETRVEETVRLNNLMTAAFDCAVLRDDGKGGGITDMEGQRLFDVGITAGRRFLDLYTKLSVDEKKSMVPEGKVEWGSIGGIWGPSNDFVLGRMVQERAEVLYSIEYDVHGTDADWQRKRERLFSEHNCIVIR